MQLNIKDYVSPRVYTPLPQRIIPWSAITIAILFTANYGYDLYNTQVNKDITEQRIAKLTIEQKRVKQTVESTPPVIERKTVVTIPKPLIQYKEREASTSSESGDLPKKAASPKVIDAQPTTVTRVERVPNPKHEEAQQQLRDVSIEIEAEGFKFKMLNEATWSMIFKLCFLWSFVLLSLGLYKYANARCQAISR